MSDDASDRDRGLAKMVEVYGDDRGFAERLANLPPESAPYSEETVDRLFAQIWDRPGLSVRDRRLLTIGVTAALGRADLAETQFVGALKGGELDRAQIGEVILHLAYYAGWPNAQAMHSGAQAAIARTEAD
jgi:alkylhydroperoxidase/carboxymuconolactone decarboxylase family protein YurZ